MPRKQNTVKPKLISRTSSAVDLHFHGAFGVDFMNTDLQTLQDLSLRLQDKGVGAICATTLSAPEKDLKAAVETLGRWAESKSHQPGCKVLGLHLEGPFIHPEYSGAHPKNSLREYSFSELEALWDLSRGTIKILTLAPETLTPEKRKELGRWAALRGVRLSLGHSKATEVEAKEAFNSGFTGITHLWNALKYHHREAGPAGAAFSDARVFIELIPDFVHVSPSFCEMTLKLFGDRTCLVSDSAPSTGLPEGKACSFGHLTCMVSGGASRIYSENIDILSPLAGGGKLLPQMLQNWVEQRTKISSRERCELLKTLGKAMSATPLQALELTRKKADTSFTKTIAKTLPTLNWYEDKKGTLSFRVTPATPPKKLKSKRKMK